MTILSTKGGKPSFHVTQRALFTGAIISCVIIIIVVTVLAYHKCNCPEPPNKPEGLKATFKPLKTSEFYLGAKPERAIGELSEEEIRQRLLLRKGSGVKERMQANAISAKFRAVRDRVEMKEHLMSTPKHKWIPPPGVQPGTLVSPPIGYTRVESNVDRGVGPLQGPLVNYNYLGDSKAGKFTATKFVNYDGSTFMGPDYSTTDTAINGMFQSSNSAATQAPEAPLSFPARPEKMRGASFLGRKVKGGISSSSWHSGSESGKRNVAAQMMSISDDFDRMLKEKIFPDLNMEEDESGNFRVKSGGQCVSLERYYEWVLNSISAMLGGVAPNSMNWAEGSRIQLGFDKIPGSIPDLRQALKWECMEAPQYKKKDGVIVSTQTDEEIAYSVIWPLDQSVLYVHKAKKLK